MKAWEGWKDRVEAALLEVARSLIGLGNILIAAGKELKLEEYQELVEWLTATHKLTKAELEAARLMATGELDLRFHLSGVPYQKIINLSENDRELLLSGVPFALKHPDPRREPYSKKWIDMSKEEKNRLLGPKGANGILEPDRQNVSSHVGGTDVSVINYDDGYYRPGVIHMSGGKGKEGRWNLSSLASALHRQGQLGNFVSDLLNVKKSLEGDGEVA
jgi:hypothetical protein